jgi:serralysin
LDGGAGNDTLQGNLSADCLVGGAGADVFVYTKTMETGAKANQRDLLMDFVPINCIDLSAIDAKTALKANPEFVWIGATVFSALGQHRYTQFSQGFGLLNGNISGACRPCRSRWAFCSEQASKYGPFKLSDRPLLS